MCFFSKDLLDYLVCPVTKMPLHYDEERQSLISSNEKITYPIKDGIPVFLTDQVIDQEKIL
jgi:uncharacterized protein YbaR (Trm112 family)